jgi:hypothetical protein
MISGPGIKAGQIFGNEASDDAAVFASLSDIFPTVLDMAGMRASTPRDLAGASLLAVARPGEAAVPRKNFVTAQYHSVYSVTGEFMIRRGKWKLITFGALQAWEESFPDQLFNMQSDPWELHDVAANPANAATIAALKSTLAAEIPTAAADAAAKADQRDWFAKYIYTGAAQCQAVLNGIFGADVNASDAAHVADWLGAPCPFTPAPAPAPADPPCAHGIRSLPDGVKGNIACCAEECGVCAHPAAACGARPGGKAACCPSDVIAAGNACPAHAAPCFIAGR